MLVLSTTNLLWLHGLFSLLVIELLLLLHMIISNVADRLYRLMHRHKLKINYMELKW
jgi:hypothetical protein